ncbi:MAG: hypothetical protein IJE74_06380 [Clostridia bacterium]|nr:hypothetical protein [Clostridia bacterium]
MLIKILIAFAGFIGFMLVFNIFLIIVGLIGSVIPIKEKHFKGPKNPLIMTDNKALVAAHRSGAKIAPENTLMAFQACAESKDFDVDLFEFDLRRSKDGKLIIVHDKTLDRTTNACEHFNETEVYVENKTYAEIRELNLGENYKDSNGNYPYRGLRGDDIPDNLRAIDIEEIFDYLESKKKYLYSIDIKNGKELGKTAADEFHEILKKRNMLDQVIFATFHQEITNYVDKTYPDFNRSASRLDFFLFYIAASFNLPLKKEWIKFNVLQIPANQFVIVRPASKRFVTYAHNLGIAVQYWTVNDAKEIKRINDIGADCIMSDLPDLAYKIIKG